MCVQIIKAVITRCGHHEVASGVADHPFNVAFVVPPRRPAELVIKQVMRLQLCKSTSPDARSVPQYSRNSDLGIVVENGLRDATKESKGRDVAITKRLGCLGWIPLHKYRVRMW